VYGAQRANLADIENNKKQKQKRTAPSGAATKSTTAWPVPE
jgi:hypothetical protein